MLQMQLSTSIGSNLYSSHAHVCIHVCHISQQHLVKMLLVLVEMLMLLVLCSLAQPANSAKWRLCSRILSSAAQPKQQKQEVN